MKITVPAFAALAILVVVAGGMMRYAIALLGMVEGMSEKAAFCGAGRARLNACWVASPLRSIHRVVGDLADEGGRGVVAVVVCDRHRLRGARKDAAAWGAAVAVDGMQVRLDLCRICLTSLESWQDVVRQAAAEKGAPPPGEPD